MSDVAAPSAAPTPSTPAPTTSAPAPKASPQASPSTPPPPSGPSAGQPKATVTPDAPEPTPAQRAEAERRKYKGKVDGAEREWALSDDEVAIRLQKAEAAERRMQQAAEMTKKMQQAVELIKKDPFAALKDPVFGLDLENLAEQRLAEKYRAELIKAQLAEAGPEQRAQLEMQMRQEELQKQLDAAVSEKQKMQQEFEARAQAELDQRTYQEIEASFTEALKTEGVPRTYEALYAMAEVAKLNLEYGIELTPQQLATEVKSRLEGETRKLESAVRSGMSGQDLLDYLGEDTVKAVLKASVTKARAGATPTPKPPPPPRQEVSDESPRQRLSTRDFRKSLGLRGVGR